MDKVWVGESVTRGFVKNFTMPYSTVIPENIEGKFVENHGAANTNGRTIFYYVSKTKVWMSYVTPKLICLFVPVLNRGFLKHIPYDGTDIT